VSWSKTGVNRIQETLSVITFADLNCRARSVICHPQCGFLWRFARYGSVECRAKCIEIAPRPLETRVRRVLLEWGISGFYDAGERSAHLGHGSASGAKIQEHGSAVCAHDDIVWGNIAMQKVVAMHQLKGVKQGLSDAIKFILGGCPPKAAQPRFERSAFLEVHYHVGGRVGFEHASDPNDTYVAKPS
jgi:hypothetical protein